MSIFLSLMKISIFEYKDFKSFVDFDNLILKMQTFFGFDFMSLLLHKIFGKFRHY